MWSEASLLVGIVACRYFDSHGEDSREKCNGGWGLVMVDRVFLVMRNLLGDSWLVAVATTSGGGNIGGVQSLNFQVENPRSGLSCLCLAMVLLKTLFYEFGLSPGWKPMIFDRATTALVHCYFPRGIIFFLENLDFGCCLGDVCAAATKNSL